MLEWEQRIVDWRRALAASIGPDPNILDELESHLRDEVDRLVQQGQAPAQAVRTAIDKLGTPEKLAAEFAKAGAAWWPIRFVLAGTGLAVGGFLVLFGFLIAHQPWNGLLFVHVIAITIGYLTSYGVGVLALCYALRRMVQDLSVGQQTSWMHAVAGSSLAAFAFTLTGTILGSIWANIHWGRFWSWDPRETGALLVLGWQALLLVVLWFFPGKVRWLICGGMLGNVAVTFAWFVAAILDQQRQLHAYGQDRHWVLLAFYAILGTHLLCMAGALAPSGWLRIRRIAE